MHTTLRTSLNTAVTIACLSLSATSVSLADKAHLPELTPALSTADEHYQLYQQLLCNCESENGPSFVQWDDDGQENHLQ